MKYFEHTHTDGRSKWWHWGFVFWITVLGWLIAQMFITSPLPTLATEIDPVLGDEFMQASMTLFETQNMALIGLAFLGFVVTTLFGFIFSIIAFTTTSKSKRTLGIIGGIFVIGSFISLGLLSPLASSPESSDVINRLLAVSPTSYALVLLTFPATLVLLYVGQTKILRRSITALHTSFTAFRWSRSLQAFAITWAVLGGLSLILHVTGTKPLSYTFDPSRFFIYAAISLALLPLQSATEEIVFRGYLNQALENISNNKWIAFILTSLLFMSLHLANPEALSGAEAGILPIVMSSYFFFGFAACLMVLIDDGLESAIGVHAANNTFAAVFVNYQNSVLPTPSVFQIKTSPVLDSCLTILTLSLILIILYRTRHRSLR